MLQGAIHRCVEPGSPELCGGCWKQRLEQALQMHKREKANSQPHGGSRQMHTDIPLAGTRKEKNCHTGRLTKETAFSLNPSEARGTFKQQVSIPGRHTWAPLTQTRRSAPFTPSQHSGTCVCNLSLPARFAGPASHVFRDLRGLGCQASLQLD